MRVAKPAARDFYEREAIECCSDKRVLERQREEKMTGLVVT